MRREAVDQVARAGARSASGRRSAARPRRCRAPRCASVRYVALVSCAAARASACTAVPSVIALTHGGAPPSKREVVLPGDPAGAHGGEARPPRRAAPASAVVVVLVGEAVGGAEGAEPLDLDAPGPGSTPRPARCPGSRRAGRARAAARSSTTARCARASAPARARARASARRCARDRASRLSSTAPSSAAARAGQPLVGDARGDPGRAVGERGRRRSARRRRRARASACGKVRPGLAAAPATRRRRRRSAGAGARRAPRPRWTRPPSSTSTEWCVRDPAPRAGRESAATPAAAHEQRERHGAARRCELPHAPHASLKSHGSQPVAHPPDGSPAGRDSRVARGRRGARGGCGGGSPHTLASATRKATPATLVVADRRRQPGRSSSGHIDVVARRSRSTASSSSDGKPIALDVSGPVRRAIRRRRPRRPT